MSEEQVLPEFGMQCRESQIAVLQDKLAQSEAEREGLQGEMARMREELAKSEQLVCDFQAAGMIDVGGMKGPCEVKPIHIENHVNDLRAGLARERERNQDLRKSVLMEALKAVESERLECHEKKIGYYHEPDEEDGDLAYSQAINVAEEAIRQLLEPQPAPVVTGEEKE